MGATSQSGQGYKYLKEVTVPGGQTAVAGFFVSGGRRRTNPKLVAVGGAFCKAALIGDIRKRKEAYHFYKC